MKYLLVVVFGLGTVSAGPILTVDAVPVSGTAEFFHDVSDAAYGWSITFQGANPQGDSVFCSLQGPTFYQGIGRGTINGVTGPMVTFMFPVDGIGRLIIYDWSREILATANIAAVMTMDHVEVSAETWGTTRTEYIISPAAVPEPTYWGILLSLVPVVYRRKG